MIISINFAILTFIFYPIFWNILGSVVMNIFLFFLEGNKNAGSAQKSRVGWVSENTAIFLGLIYRR